MTGVSAADVDRGSMHVYLQSVLFLYLPRGAASGIKGKKKRGIQNMRFQLLIVLGVIALCIGCEKNISEQSEEKIENVEHKKEQEVLSKSQKLAEGYREIYITATRQGSLNTLEFQQRIVDYIGSLGYTAVDRGNQINMVHFEEAVRFARVRKKSRMIKLRFFPL